MKKLFLFMKSYKVEYKCCREERAFVTPQGERMSNLAISSSCSPFPNQDTFIYCSAKYLRLSDIVCAALVCKLWGQSFSDQTLWKNLSEREGIPLVSGERNYREDFKILYPITISSAIIGQFLGRVIGKVPPISEKRFNELKQPDPFESSKLKVENYVFIVVPSLVARTANKETPLALNDSKDLVEVSTVEERELRIPFSLKNIKALCSYPLKGKENMPVFKEHRASQVFEQCGACSDKISVYFMRRHIVGRWREYPEQEKLVKDAGFDVTPLRERAIYDALVILQSGTCPDGRDPLTYTRNPDTVRYGNGVYQSVIGDFIPRTGMCVGSNSLSYCDSSVGVVPGGPTEAPQAIL